ncbi:MAG TPA: glycosyltransferase family 2 protein [Roseomonas sp.]|jgi:hypothetical protein
MQDAIQVAGIAIAIPARDEAVRLPRCLRALARQIATGFSWPDLTVIVTANNCSDDTAVLARAMAPALPFRLLVQEIRLPKQDAHAGGARAAAMGIAARHLPPRGLLISTDADAEPAPAWLAAKLSARAAGADAVAGAVDLHAGEFAALPTELRRQLSREIMYAEALDQLAALVDPEPRDPWPRHHWHSGASMALSRDAWDRIGGLPRVKAGEDRALFAAVRRAGLLVRHEPQARVTVSCRLEGRAVAGMADTLKRRLAAESDTADTRLEPARLALRRLRCRRGLRRLWQGEGSLSEVAACCGVPAAAVRGTLGAASFWAAWEALEASAPGLRRQPLRLRDLAAELRTAQRLIAMRAWPGAARRCDSAGGGDAAAGPHPYPAPR